MSTRCLNFLKHAAGLSIAVFVIWTVANELKDYSLSGIITALASIPSWKILLALLITCVDYVIIASVDLLGLHWLGFALSMPETAFAAVIGNALWCNAGVIAGSSAKFRLYSKMGLSTVHIGSLITFTSITCFLGLFFLGGILHLLYPVPEIQDILPLPLDSSRIMASIFLVLVAAYLVFSLLKKKDLHMGDHVISLPDFKTALTQVILASTDWILAGCVLLILLPSVEGTSPLSILAIYILAQMGVLASQIPGGLGVLEGMLLILFPESLKGDGEIAAILAFRIIFSLVPLLLSSISFGMFEIWNRITVRSPEKGYNNVD